MMLRLRLITALGAAMLTCALSQAQSGVTHYVTPDAPLLGSAWYPEQWPESRWDADLSLMEQAHFNVVRIGEFAWSAEEPSEGHYDFAWLDRAIALAAKHHIAVVLGTPTDAPPAWLTTKYPQTLRFDEGGHRAEHGGRRQFNYANPLYRRFCFEIVAQLARRYGHNPNVIGWQIGNEYTDESFDPATRAQFEQFLRNKYKTLSNLNYHWTTAYWSQTYTTWSQIPLESTHGNPGLLLEHKHFVTATWRSFQRNQIDALRPLISHSQFITTNIGGLAWSDNWDHYAITADLDLAAWDDYVGQGHLDAPKNAMLNDFVRGWRRQNFWIMETQPASVNWAPINNALDPGETRALAWQAVGHGADAILYWQWRSALNGQEQYHGAIVGPDGKPLPLYSELQQLGEDFARTRAALANTTPQSTIALLHTYDSRWAIDFQPQSVLYNQQQVLLRFYKPLSRLAQSNGQSIDIVDPTQPGSLSQYKLLLAPSLNVIDDALAARLLAYVQQGGHLLLGPRSGMKDQYNALNPQRQPGPLAAALGGKVEQYYALAPQRPAPKLTGSAGSGTSDIWAEALTASSPETHTDLTYHDPAGWLDQQPAMLTRHIGRGTIAYLGTLPDDNLLASILAKAADLHATQQIPDDVELCTRRSANGDRTVLIMINHARKPRQMTLPAAYTDLLHQATLIVAPSQTTIILPAQGIAVLVAKSSR
ncbi:beta-galactosidase [Edaphobacter dinghuensis]|uniref:Beta-galactosidase n=1 Tax=Edaphobacter dinghuensis TaxID=1560005 RepID=A0A917HM94_9BACT|nr:beta-galactosidase [Edaphobacter dinghuensis]GGG84243.1 beta-galactosidase [Edaphobacter dinghuensis]